MMNNFSLRKLAKKNGEKDNLLKNLILVMLIYFLFAVLTFSIEGINRFGLFIMTLAVLSLLFIFYDLKR